MDWYQNRWPVSIRRNRMVVDFHDNGTPINAPETNNVPVFRLSEIYLIAAEAAVKTSNGEAGTYLNAIVERANPDATVAASEVTLDRVLTERRKELAAEGHRLFDLIRNKRDIVRTMSSRVFDISTPLHIPYNNYKVIFPIPRVELNINPLIQNPGYAD